MTVEGLPAQLVSPGVFRAASVRRTQSALQTGVPAFLGFAPDGRGRDPIPVSRGADARLVVGYPGSGAALANAVDGFFVNGGRACFIVPLDRDKEPGQALEAGLDALERCDAEVDLICAPDVVPILDPERRLNTAEIDRVMGLQQTVLDRCGQGTGWFAILDGLPGSNTDDVLRQRGQLHSADGALYLPWIRVTNPLWSGRAATLVPPCGHVAGVFSRVDRTVGVHKAPANEVLDGVVDLERPVTAEVQDRLNPVGVNCLRSFPGRGIRVWGARTLSGQPAWRHVNVRRLVLTIGRRVERDLTHVTFEPHGPELWARVRSSVAACLTEHFRRGALSGRTPREAFYVKCDAETNPPEYRAEGRIVTEVGLAPNGSMEFIVVHLVQDARGTSFGEPPETI